MVARVATFEGVNVEEAKRTMDEVEAAVRPLMEGLAGYQGYVELIAENGKVLSITYFDTMENCEAAEPTFDEEMPRRLGEIFGSWEGRRTSVDRYEVAAEARS